MKVKSIIQASLLSLLLAECCSFRTHASRPDSTRFIGQIGQVSVVPGLGTSGGANSGQINKFSLNILAGSEFGLNGLEIGSIYNAIKYDATGMQIAGVGNKAGGHVSGAQVSGLVNIAGGELNGGQFAGIINFSNGRANGVQSAGAVNFANGSVIGMQATAGVNYANGYFHGTQLAGVYNKCFGASTGMQLSGLINDADSLAGIQAAGVINSSTGNIYGLQIAGVLNQANRVGGAQVSGLINKAHVVNGSQFGLINIADTVKNGVVLGLFNFVKDGITEPAIQYNEVFDANFYFRSGTRRLYTIMFVGFQAQKIQEERGDESFWTYGAGFGTQFKLNRRFYTNLELTSQNISPRDRHNDDLHLLNKASLDIGLQIGKHFSISTGPSFNVYVTQSFDEENRTYGFDIAPWTFSDVNYGGTSNPTNVKMWLGYNVAIKF